MKQLFLNFNGIQVCLANRKSEQCEVLDHMKFSFEPFVVNTICSPDIKFEIVETIPNEFKYLLPVPFFPQFRVYGWWNKRRIHYTAQSIAASAESGEFRQFWFVSDDAAILNEMVYLAILSSVGERYDLRGLHRIHGFGIDCLGHCALIIANSGVGKSAMTLLLSKFSPELRFFSDESPLLSQSNTGVTIHPFPTRIALQSQVAADLGISGHRQFRRINYPEKLLMTFPRIAKNGTLRTLVFARPNSKDRSLHSTIYKTSRFKASLELFRPLVVGAGLAQMAIWMLRLSAVPRLTKILFFRICLYIRILRLIPETYIMLTNLDARKNAQAVAEFFGIKSAVSPGSERTIPEVTF